MNRMKLIVLLIVLMQLVGSIFSANILGYLVTPMRSHFIIHDSLLRGLAARGHNVTVVSTFPAPSKPILNYRHVHVPMSAEDEASVVNFMTMFIESKDQNLYNRFKNAPVIMSGMSAFHNFMLNSLMHPAVEQLKRDERFDIVAFGYFIINDYQLGLAAHFQCPSVLISATASMKILRDFVGNPSNVATVPSIFLTVEAIQMSYKERVYNYLIMIAETVVQFQLYYFVSLPAYEKIFPSDRYPSLKEAQHNVSLVLVSSHFSQGAPLSTFPGLLEVSGMHIDNRPNPLPSNIQIWLDEATDGVIFFSLGSNMKSALLPKEKLNILLKVFAKLKQRVLWKWEDENLPERPDNVMVGKWLPQADILAHPNVKVFFSHCGKGSVNEAKSNGVPILAMPMFGDQPANAVVIVNDGWAVEVDYVTLSEESLSAALNEVLNNSKYRDVVKTAADIYKDRPAHPLETAIYWVEYVIRHKGAKHMQSQAVYLNFWQTNSLDVLALLLFVAFVSFKIWWWAVRFAWRKMVGTARKVKRA